MAIRIEPGRDYIFVDANDAFDMVDVWAAFEEIAKIGVARSPLRVLIVDQGTHLRATTPEDVKQIVGIWKKVFRTQSVDIAIVVQSDMQFGMGRMLSALGQDSPVSCEVFRDRDTAERWLLGKPYPPGS